VRGGVVRALELLLVLTTIPTIAGLIAIALASPQTGEEGAEIGHILLLVVVGVGSLAVDAVLLRRVFRRIEPHTAVGMMSLSAALTSIALALALPSNDPTTGSLELARLLAIFFLFLLPGLLVGLLLFAVLPRSQRDRF